MPGALSEKEKGGGDKEGLDVDDLTFDAGWVGGSGRIRREVHAVHRDGDALGKIGGEDFANGSSGWGYEEEKADGVGQETGGQENSAGDEDEEAVGEFFGGEFSGSGGFLEVVEGFCALGFGEGGPDDGGEDDDDEGVDEAEAVAKGQEDGELGDGDEDEEQQKFSEHQAEG